MRKFSLLVLFSICLLNSFGQKNEFIKSGQSEFSEKYDTVGTWIEHEITLIFRKPDSIQVRNQYVEINIEHVTTSKDDVKLKQTVAKIDDIAFTSKDSIELTFSFQIRGDSIPENDELFFITLVADSAFKCWDLKIPITIKNDVSPDKSMSILEKTLAGFEMKDSVDLGYFMLNRNADQIPVFKFENGLGESIGLEVDLDELTIHSNEGRIEQLILVCVGVDGHFQTDRPVSLTNIENHLNTPMIYTGPDEHFKGTAVKIGDVFTFRRDTDKRYFPPNEKYRLTKELPVQKVQLAASILDYVDGRAYTDFLGLNGQENGLFQTEINLRFIGNTQNLFRKNKGYYSRGTWFQYVNLNLSYSKFDSKFDTLDLRTVTTLQDSLKGNLLPIIQHSSLSFNLDIDLYRYSRVHDFTFTFGHRINVSDVIDTTGTYRLVNPFLYLQIGGILRANPVFQCSFSLPFLFNYTFDQKFYNFENKWMIVIQPTVELMYHPLNAKKKPGSSGYFVRVRYFDMPWKQSQNFLQVQIGTSISISEIAENRK